ncbi:MAG: pyruvate ferredoxin oxidoreductase [Deltaproteobacteria bacterium]|nr:pyruvate ferredoxin oxidoreductase [Deltaproteobacteria bacterium]
MKKFLSGNHAVAEAVRLCRTQIVAAYPITPQTPIYEKLSEWEASGDLGGLMMRMESEHSAMAACLSASLTGARTFTATSSQGLALMHEMLHFTAGCRAPVVMVNINRTLAAPWAFWSDQTDSLSQRDTGWMQIYCEDNQESLDSVIQAFRIAETVLLPCMVVAEGHFISHFMEPVEVPEQALVDRYLPAVNIPKRFDVDNPGYVVPTVSQNQFREFRRMSQEAMEYALGVISEADEDFAEAVDTQGADLVLVTTATITSTARVAVANLREKGYRIGLVRIRVFRPFPTGALRDVLDSVPRIAVIERNISIGREGIFCAELKAALIHSPVRRWVQGYLAGIGGSNVDPDMIERIAMDALHRREPKDSPIWITEES